MSVWDSDTDELILEEARLRHLDRYPIAKLPLMSCTTPYAIAVIDYRDDPPKVTRTVNASCCRLGGFYSLERGA
jgi:hypothetical protein